MKANVPHSHFLLVLALALLGITFSCNSPESSAGDEYSPEEQKLDHYIDLEAGQGLSGIIAVLKSSGDIFYKAAGFADREQQVGIDENTVFDIGSLTKQFTGAALLKLEMDGKLSVDDSLSSFFENLPPDKAAITIHQLLTHSSGFPKRIGSDFENLKKEEFLNRAFNTPLLYNPGERFEYSHSGYSLLGILIERVSGLSYESYLNKAFFTPLGMNHTGYVIPSWDPNQVANGYRKCKNWGKPMDLSWGPEGPYWNLKANAGLLSTASDLMIWRKSLDSNIILSDSAKKKFLERHIREGEASSFYGYGWMVTTSQRGTIAYAHEGGNGKFFSDWINYPQESVSILVLMNDYRPNNWNIASEVARILFYPNHEPEIQLQTIHCYDSLPNSQIGRIAGNFISLLSLQDAKSINPFIDLHIGKYLKERNTPDRINGVLEVIQNDCGPVRIGQVIVTDNSYMELECYRLTDQQRIQIQISFDKEDDYKIRRFRYNSNDS